MRDTIEPPRNAVLSGEHLVASSHPAVSATGHRVLAGGGTAIDATLAMAALSWLALPGQCGVGGDAFAVVREPDGRVWTVGGSGFGPDGGDPSFYRERGCKSLPLTGGLAVAAPGAIGAMAALHARGATRAVDELWAPAITAAERGLPCTAKTRADILDHEIALRQDEGTYDMFLRDGRAPQIGERLPQPELARSLRLLARDPAALYAGELADRAVAALVEGGAPFSGAEWQASGTPLVEPAITGDFGEFVIHQTPLPTPGWMVLQQAALCDRSLAELPWLSAAAVDLMAGAARQAFADRFARCGSDTATWAALLDP
ncbi:MAG: gamma-glutamyltransferase, partial [Jatrophihabitantaceae bacterium]